jgi:hypothetical protein
MRWLARLAPIGFIVAALGTLWLRFTVVPSASPGSAVVRTVGSDFLNYYVPMAEHVARRLAAGEIPLWNPEACSGMPLLATLQSGVFHPRSWLAVLLPAHRALLAVGLVECALGGIFAFWLFRAWGFARFASTLGGVLFVFACCLGQTLWPPAVASIVWIPWLLLCVEKLCGGWHAGWWAGLALGGALQILAGFPQYVVYGYGLVGPYAALRLVERRLRAGGSWRRLGVSAVALASALVVGIGLAGMQLLPTLELAGRSVRQARLNPREVHYLTHLLHFDTGHVLRAAFDPSPGFITFGLGAGVGYLGIASLMLLGVGVVARAREPRTWLLLGVGGLALLLSDGYLGWRDLYESFARLPLVGSLRSPERLRVVTLLCAIVLVVGGFDAFERPALEAGRRRRLTLSLVLAAFGVAIGMAATGHAGEAWRVALGLLLLLLLQRGAPNLGPRWLVATLLLVFVTADVAMATRRTAAFRRVPLHAAHVYRVPETGVRVPLEYLAQQREEVGTARFELVGFRPMVAGGPSGGLRRPSCYEPLVPLQWAALHRALTGEKSRGQTLHDLDPKAFPALYDVTSVPRILVAREGEGVTLVDNPDALPRAFLRSRYELTRPAAAIRRIARGDVALGREVLLERDPGLAGSGEVAGGTARIAEDLPERVVVEVEARAPALLVLTDSHYPGWTAQVEGRPAEILLANGLHRAVRVGAGRQRVVFEYRPRSFRRGAALSLLSLAALVSVVAASRWRQR